MCCSKVSIPKTTLIIFRHAMYKWIATVIATKPNEHPFKTKSLTKNIQPEQLIYHIKRQSDATLQNHSKKLNFIAMSRYLWIQFRNERLSPLCEMHGFKIKPLIHQHIHNVNSISVLSPRSSLPRNGIIP